jgi:bifunctional DNA-binding transcriptional regulator/antitoxin component of YhaV-PrlF toxin-antitoxin module
MVIPAQARKQARIDTGDVLNIRVEGDGRLIMVRLAQPKEKPPAKVRILQRKGKHPLVTLAGPSRGRQLKPPWLSSHESDEVTDLYLAELASSKGMKLATFDGHIKHAAVQVIK